MYLSCYTSAGHKGAVEWSYLKRADVWKKPRPNGAGSLSILHTVSSAGAKFGATLYGHPPSSSVLCEELPWSMWPISITVTQLAWTSCWNFRRGTELENRLSGILQREVTLRYSPTNTNIRIQFLRNARKHHITSYFTHLRSWELSPVSSAHLFKFVKSESLQIICSLVFVNYPRFVCYRARAADNVRK
jgi:hypothetical protein